MFNALASWRRELRRYDADPGAWDRPYLRKLLTSFAQGHGSDRARVFGMKFVARQLLRPEDIDAAVTVGRGDDV